MIPSKGRYASQSTIPESNCTKALSDSEALQYSDAEILAAARAKLTSGVYGHYKIRVKRPEPGDPPSVVLQFECIHDEPMHPPYSRHWKANINGSLWGAADRCNQRRKRKADADRSIIKTTNPNKSQGSARSLQLQQLAILCIHSSLHRALTWPTGSTAPWGFDGAVDQFQDAPSSSLVVQNLGRIYLALSCIASRYFQRLPGAVHLIIDGWTNQTPTNSLACMTATWQEEGLSFRSILDVLWISDLSLQNHVADFIAECLERYGLKDKVKTICLRNAPQSKQVLGRLHGKHSMASCHRTLCYSHVVGLMLETFTSFLRPLPRVTPVKFLRDAEDEDGTEIDDLELDASLSETEYNADLVQEAVRNAKRELAQRDIVIDRTELQGARTILGKVVALEQGANRVNPALQEAYCSRFPLEPVSETPGLVVRPRKSINWGTIHDSMIRYSDFISSLNPTAAGSNMPVPTDCHNMDKAEQKILDEFNTILEIFDDVVRVLSHEKSPPLYEVVMKLLDLKTRLGEIRDGHGLEIVLTSVTRLAAGAALCAYKLMVGNDELPEIAIVAIAMHPASKLKWFKTQGTDTGKVRETVVEHFNRDYYINEENMAGSKSAPAIDSIVDYLSAPVLPREIIEERGGVLNYWRQELELQPRVARMALDYLTIPASSVDRARILSGGQIPTNGLENHLELDTFRAMMSIGSWFGTPVLPDMNAVTAILEDRSEF